MIFAQARIPHRILAEEYSIYSKPFSGGKASRFVSRFLFTRRFFCISETGTQPH
jgi:hypothetical protein